MDTDGNGLEVLDSERCLELLEASSVGRIGITSGALPLIFPVNYTVSGDRLFIRTCRGTKLDAAADHSVVAFEVDDLGFDTHAGWSVLVIGVARPENPGRWHTLPVLPPRWAGVGEDERLISISIDVISGRRITLARGSGGSPPTPVVAASA